MDNKVLVQRMSGTPVDIKLYEECQQMWKDGFDEITAKFGKVGPETSKELEILENMLSNVYKEYCTEHWDFLDTEDKFKEKLSEYGTIMVGTHVETGELVYLIVDQQL